MNTSQQSDLQKAAKLFDFNLSPSTELLLQNYGKPVGIGAATGALGLGAMDLAREKEPEENRATSLLKSMALGGLLGGGAGAGYQSLKNLWEGDPGNQLPVDTSKTHVQPNHMSALDAYKHTTNHPVLSGVVAGGGAGAWNIKKMLSESKALKGLKGGQITLSGFNPGSEVGQAQMKHELRAKRLLDLMHGAEAKAIPGLQAGYEKEMVKGYTDSKNSLGEILRATGGKPTRGTLQTIINALNQKVPYYSTGSKSGFNPVVARLTKNVPFLQLRELLGPMVGHMPALQRLSFTLANNAATIPTQLDRGMSWLGKKLPQNKVTNWMANRNPYMAWDTPLDKIQPKEMPLGTKGIGNFKIDPTTGKQLISRYASQPTSKTLKAVANGKVPLGWGSGRLLGPLALGGGVAGGTHMANKYFKDTDALELLQASPELAQYANRWEAAEAARQAAMQTQGIAQ